MLTAVGFSCSIPFKYNKMYYMYIIAHMSDGSIQLLACMDSRTLDWFEQIKEYALPLLKNGTDYEEVFAYGNSTCRLQ